MILKFFSSRTITILKKGGIGVIPTDTIYGLVSSALNKKTVEKIYRLKNRNSKKPLIILIGDISDLKKFGINLTPNTYNLKPETWPPKTSILLPCPSAKFKYLHRGTKTLAFRLPASRSLQPTTHNLKTFLKKTGPLVAPSANLEGQPPAKTAKEAKKYFGDKVDFYVDGGYLGGKPSLLLKPRGSKFKIIRN